jgi:hypothetical protein
MGKLKTEEIFNLFNLVVFLVANLATSIFFGLALSSFFGGAAMFFGFITLGSLLYYITGLMMP